MIEEIFALPKILAKNFVEHPKGAAARFLDCRVAAGQTKSAQVRDAPAGFLFDEKKLSAPDGAICSITGPVPGHAEERRFEFIFRHAGSDVGPMMLHTHFPARLLQGVFGREIFRVQIVRDDLRLRLVELRQIQPPSD